MKAGCRQKMISPKNLILQIRRIGLHESLIIIPGAAEEVISRKGQTLDRNIFETMRKEFYELRGWDAESGLHKIGTLRKARVDELVQDLRKIIIR